MIGDASSFIIKSESYYIKVVFVRRKDFILFLSITDVFIGGDSDFLDDVYVFLTVTF